MLFIDGGVFTVFLEDRKLSRAEFFERCRAVLLADGTAGAVFGCAIRLAGCGRMSESPTMRKSCPAMLRRSGWDFLSTLASKLVIVVLALLVRLWFDLAQARVVRGNERRVFRTLMRSFKLAFALWGCMRANRNRIVCRGDVWGWEFAVWVFLPHSAMGASFLVLELVTITQIASRLWMKAASARWVGVAAGRSEDVPAAVDEALVSVIEGLTVDNRQARVRTLARLFAARKSSDHF